MTRRILTCSHWLITAIFPAVAILMFTTNAFAGALEKVIHTFQGSPDGQDPEGALITDRAGNLYGTTQLGGNCCGTVFQLSPPATQGGTWTLTPLYTFAGGNNDGANPVGALVLDKLGNLYGTTSRGGPSDKGTVFQLSPPAVQGGAWTESVLYFFPADGSHGSNPRANLIFDPAGNVYGTSGDGGGGTNCSFNQNACGAVFELSPPATQGGAWTQIVLHSFGLIADDGNHPEGGLIFDRTGALYGTTQLGGAVQSNHGTVFQLVRKQGQWSENILYNFGTTGLANPVSSLIFDSPGNLYGTTAGGGNGGVFELSPPAVAGNPWTETTLYSFTGGRDGGSPEGAVIFDKAGNLYSTTFAGGLKNSQTNNNGTVFELSPPAIAGGAWTETTLHEFGGPTYGDGSSPTAGLILLNGKFYGTTSRGISFAPGTVFSLVITP